MARARSFFGEWIHGASATSRLDFKTHGRRTKAHLGRRVGDDARRARRRAGRTAVAAAGGARRRAATAAVVLRSELGRERAVRRFGALPEGGLQHEAPVRAVVVERVDGLGHGALGAAPQPPSAEDTAVIRPHEVANFGKSLRLLKPNSVIWKFLIMYESSCFVLCRH